jgi:methyl-accepting chemotaxis protein
VAEYIDGRFKRRFIIRLLAGMAVISLVSSLLLFAILPKETADRYVALIYTLRETQQSILPLIIIIGFFEIIVALLFTLLLALFISHKVGGPIFKLEQNIEKLKRGNLRLSEISFRDEDQAQILAMRFNEMLESWHVHITELKYNYCKLAARMDTLQENCQAGADESDGRLIKRMKHDLDKMQDVLDRFAV